LNIEDFNFLLDDNLIALYPAEPRDTSKLLCLKAGGILVDSYFYNLPNLLNKGDTLVINETKVIPTFLEGYRYRGENKANISFNLIKKIDAYSWDVLLKPLRKIKVNETIQFKKITGFPEVYAKVISVDSDSIVRIKFNNISTSLDEWIQSIGNVPLPPYIKSKRSISDNDIDSYQTIYAKNKGSVAAPTAGLHFTDNVMSKLTTKGVNICKLTLHVGIGTFLPIKTDNILSHKMHSEWGLLSSDNVDILNNTKKNGKKIIAVGTTSLRLLETACDDSGLFSPYEGETDIYITPGYQFKAIDVLITNFHLPKSSLFVLVASLYGLNDIKHAYNHAINSLYRFYSYGDVCFIEKNY
jgi:S-adenosylmethionine:tRNA ribosyltransferase-isomerase